MFSVSAEVSAIVNTDPARAARAVSSEIQKDAAEARDRLSQIEADVQQARSLVDFFTAQGKMAGPVDPSKVQLGGSALVVQRHRVGSREALIDAVVPAVAGEKLKTLTEHTLAQESPRARLQTVVSCMIDPQPSDPALNDAMLRRFPSAITLVYACERSTALGARLAEEAHAAGVLSTSFTADDLMAMLWMAGTARRDEAAPSGWRRVVDRGLTAACTHPSD